MEKSLLSVVIISHNQRDVLKRCIDSCLAQKTNFPVEVIVSDDRSNDGTREMLYCEYKDKVISTYFNSDDYETSYILERAALNRINGLKKATGKYLIHIDGDDFFTGTGLFQAMVDKLETHPECTLCCQNYYQKPYDDIDSIKDPVMPVVFFEGERILSGAAFLEEARIGHNSCFCLRRTDEITLEDLSSNTYDDIDITFRYLGKGKIALLNRCDFVYVQYPGSSSTSITPVEKTIMYNSFVVGIPLAPAIAGILLKNHLHSVALIYLEGMKNRTFPERLVKYCRKFDIRMFKRLNEHMKLKDRLIYGLLFFLIGIIIVMPYKTKGMIKIVYKIAINKNIANDVII